MKYIIHFILAFITMYHILNILNIFSSILHKIITKTHNYCHLNMYVKYNIYYKHVHTKL